MLLKRLKIRLKQASRRSVISRNFKYNNILNLIKRASLLSRKTRNLGKKTIDIF